jgi:N-hydroxyarylamine O-acetyltransferase
MKLDRYLQRISYEGARTPDLATLAALQRAHILALTFENLDVQLQRPLTTDVEEAYEKIVERGRGGWCYEMNGLFGWALTEIGFDVTRLGAGVMREASGDAALGNHLCLLIQCDGARFADVGFGGSLTKILPFIESDLTDDPFNISLKKIDQGFWRFAETAGSSPFSFDFRPVPADEALLSAKCRYLQRDPSSPFVANLVAQRRRKTEHLALRGRVLTTTKRSGRETTLIDTADDLAACLKATFGLDVPEIRTLWPDICRRHDEVFAAQNA